VLSATALTSSLTQSGMVRMARRSSSSGVRLGRLYLQ
jgi:hypothetical protein